MQFDLQQQQQQQQQQPQQQQHFQDCLELMEGFVAVFHEQLDPAVVCASSFCPNTGVDEILEAAEDDVFEAVDIEILDNRIVQEDEITTIPPTTVPPKTTTPPPKPLPR